MTDRIVFSDEPIVFKFRSGHSITFTPDGNGGYESAYPNGLAIFEACARGEDELLNGELELEPIEEP